MLKSNHIFRNFEFPLITKHGVRIEVLLNPTTRRDEQGNVIGVVGIGQDVSFIFSRKVRVEPKVLPSLTPFVFNIDHGSYRPRKRVFQAY